MGTHPIFESDFDCLTEIMSDSNNDLERLERGPLPQFPDIPLSKPGPHFTSLLTTKPGEMADTNTHLEILQNELEEMLFNSTQRLYNLKEEEKVDDETIMLDRNVKKKPKKRKQSKLLEATQSKKSKIEEPALKAPPPIIPPRSKEFWDYVTKNASYVPEESHKFLSELIARPADTALLAKTSSIQVKSRRRESQSNVLSSKLNSIKIKEKPENDHKINESQVEERLSKAGILIENDSELLSELEYCQSELRELQNKNRWHALILQKRAKNHDKFIKNLDKLTKLDTEIMSEVKKSISTKSYHEKFKAQRAKYTKTIDNIHLKNKNITVQTKKTRR